MFDGGSFARKGYCTLKFRFVFNKCESEIMQTANNPGIQAMLVPQQFAVQYLPLERVTKPNLTTAETAH